MATPAPKTVLLVPFSSNDQSRILIWQHVHSWLTQTLDYPLYLGEHFPETPGTYNLSLARNLAAQKAGDWEVAVIHDADTVINPQQITAGVAAAYETGAVTYPYTERWELDFTGTKMLLSDETSKWQQYMTPYAHNQPLGGCIIVRRDLWELVRGFDTGFVGWGHEDGAFAIACQVLSGKLLQRIPGKSLHLEHVLAPAKRPDNPIYRANKARIDQYIQAGDQPNGYELIRKLRDASIATDQASGIHWSPNESENKGMNTTTALMLLRDVAAVLEKYQCTHWLSDGTLLGTMRENDFIAHDDDVDLGVWAADFDIRVIHELINRYGCRIVRLQGTPDDGMIISVQRLTVHLDMFFYYPLAKSEKGHPSAKIYHSIYFLEKPYNTSNKARRYNCVYPDFKPLVRRSFKGHEFWVPENAKQHLVAAYGKDWRKPQPNWDTEKDQPNLVRHGTASDMAADRQQVEQFLKIRRL
ncbi:MAG: LicD family protein [Candidatus Saccharibacteria bacterium]